MTLRDAWEASNGVAHCERSSYGLCKFGTLYEDDDMVAEECEHCGKRVGYNKIDGRIDNAKYLHDHIRDFLQPYGRTANLFWLVYGDAGYERIKRLKQAKKPIPTVDQMRDEARDVYKTVKKLLDSGHKASEL